MGAFEVFACVILMVNMPAVSASFEYSDCVNSTDNVHCALNVQEDTPISLLQTASNQLAYHQGKALKRTINTVNSSGSCSKSCNNGCCTCAPSNCDAACSAQSNQDTCYEQHCTNSNSQSTSCSVSCSNGVCTCAGNGCGSDQYKDRCPDWKSPYEAFCSRHDSLINGIACLGGALNGNLCCSKPILLQTGQLEQHNTTMLERTISTANTSGSCSKSCNNGCCTCAPSNCDAACSAQSNQDTCYDQYCSNSNSQSTSCSVSCSNGVCTCAGNGCGADQYKDRCPDWESPYASLCATLSSSRSPSTSAADCSDITEPCTSIYGPAKCQYSDSQLTEFREQANLEKIAENEICLLAAWPAVPSETSRGNQNCEEYYNDVGCGWTETYNCRDANQIGSPQTAGDDGSLGFCCCCKAGYWKTHVFGA